VVNDAIELLHAAILRVETIVCCSDASGQCLSIGSQLRVERSCERILVGKAADEAASAFAERDELWPDPRSTCSAGHAARRPCRA
jgi:hypothetical protein